MGAAIARRVAGAGFELTLWNRTPERARAVGAGVVASSPDEAVEGAEVVLSILYDAASVRQVLGGLRPRPGQVWVEMTTAGPDVVEELARRLAGAGAELVHAPIVGSIPAVEQGTALILAGGGPEAFERAGPVLAAFGQPEHVGSRREAAGLKLLSNAMLGICSLAAAELLAAGRLAGLDQEAAFRLLTRLVPYLQARRRGYLERSHDQPMFELAGIVKDLGLALDLGRQAGAAMPATALSRELYALAVPAHGREEMTAVIEEYPA